MLLQVSWWQNPGGVVHGRLLFCGHVWCRGAGSPLYSETRVACSHNDESAPRSTGKVMYDYYKCVLLTWWWDYKICLPSLQQYTDPPPIFSLCSAHIKWTWCLTSTETIRLIREGVWVVEWGMEMGREGGREIIYLSLHCHHQNDLQ